VSVLVLWCRFNRLLDTSTFSEHVSNWHRRSRIARQQPTNSISMSRDPRSRRLTRPAAGPPPAGAETVPLPLTSLIAHSMTPNDLLPRLHQHALDVTGGACSLLFQHNPRTGSLQATSGFGLDALRTDPWMPGSEEAALISDAFTRKMPTLIPDAR
jgi:hypothetical protein